MKEASWGKEPFDLRLTVLRMIKLLPGILAITALAILLLFGGYYLKNVVLDQEKTYSATITIFVEYEDENWYANARYFNDYTWNLLLASDQMHGYVKNHLPEGTEIKEREDDLLVAEMPADLRVLIIRSVSADQQKATARIDAVAAALQQEFTRDVEDVREIRVIDRKEASLNLEDLRLGRAFVLSAIVGVFAAVCFFLIRELMQDKIWLPTSLTDRFGLKNLGIPGEKTFMENYAYVFQGKKNIVACSAEKTLDPAEIVQFLKEANLQGSVLPTPVPCPLDAPENVGKLREADGILLAVKAGGKDAKNLELLLNFLETQDCKVTAAVLWKPDRRLLRIYYRF